MEKTILAETPVASSCNEATLDFERLVHAHGRFLFSIAYSVIRNPEDAEEVVQETFFRAFRTGKLEKVEHIRPWLGRIAWRLALNHSKNRSRYQRKIHADELVHTLPAEEPGVEDLLIRQERAKLLERVLMSIPRDLRETFVLLTVEEMTSRRASEILEIPESSVRNRLFRARKLIKAKLLVLLEDGNES